LKKSLRILKRFWKKVSGSRGKIFGKFSKYKKCAKMTSLEIAQIAGLAKITFSDGGC